MVEAFYYYYYYLPSSVLKPNLKKSEIADIRFRKGVQIAVCGLYCFDLNNDTLKILGTHFSYNEKLKVKKKKNCKTVKDIQRVLKTWKKRNLTVVGKIIIFKTIAVSKIVFQSFIATVPKYIINELEKIEKASLWKNATPKIKHETLCNDCKAEKIKKCQFYKQKYGSSMLLD